MDKSNVKGTRDFLPEDMRKREYLKNLILDAYQKYGYQLIQTPILENLENLTKSEGGENLALIFKILKRGNKLDKALKSGTEDENELCDIGLRYDLTLPLSRFFANNRNDLEMPFRSIQIGNVYRAENTQKGRFREFIQCDIDIIGEPKNYAEIELILATTRALEALGLKNFTVLVNDRKNLFEMYQEAGFSDLGKFNQFCIELDKLDKIGKEKVISNIAGLGLEKKAAADFFANLEEHRGNDNIRNIINTLKEIRGDEIVRYEPSLVRGLGYYTGTIFEIVSSDFKGSIAGGGRYDGMISAFGKGDEVIPAIGFSIGFERIYELMKDKLTLPEENSAYFSEEEKLIRNLKNLEARRDKGERITFYLRGKKSGKLMNRLEEKGFKIEKD